jgi:ABC-type ATPase involved in cell division
LVATHNRQVLEDANRRVITLNQGRVVSDTGTAA